MLLMPSPKSSGLLALPASLTAVTVSHKTSCVCTLVSLWCPTCGTVRSSFITHPIEGVVEPGEGEEEEVGVERGEGRPEGLHDAEDQMETVKGHQPCKMDG